MNAFDLIVIALTATLVVVGLVRGLVRIVVALGAVLVAFVIASRFHRPVADTLSATGLPEQVLWLASYLLLFLGVMIAGAVVARLLQRLLEAAMLGWVDRIAGATLGLATAVLLAALIVQPLIAYSPSAAHHFEGSKLAPYVSVVADVVNRLVPESMADRYREGVKALRRVWNGERVVGLGPDTIRVG